MILILLTGGASQHDTFDLKPDAPDGIRGEFQPIATSVPGIQICEHLPLLAARAERYALVRSMSHDQAYQYLASKLQALQAVDKDRAVAAMDTVRELLSRYGSPREQT